MSLARNDGRRSARTHGNGTSDVRRVPFSLGQFWSRQVGLLSLLFRALGLPKEAVHDGPRSYWLGATVFRREFTDDIHFITRQSSQDEGFGKRAKDCKRT